MPNIKFSRIQNLLIINTLKKKNVKIIYKTIHYIIFISNNIYTFVIILV